MIEVNELIRRDLNLLVASYEIDEASLVKRMKHLPAFYDFVVFDFFRQLEKQYLVGGAGDQNLVVDEIHLG